VAVATVLAWINVAVLAAAAGIVTLVSLIPLAMANDDPGVGPLVASGAGQLITLCGLVAAAGGGVAVAVRAAFVPGGWAAAWGLGGWLVWAGGYAASVAALFAMARLGSH
jgi:hypothetical protein